MRASLDILAQQNTLLTDIARHGEKDSKTLKALTLVATLYLPASLVATIFSSELIQSQPDGSVPGGTHFVVASQFWIFVVSSSILMAVTYVSMRWLERHLMRTRP